MSRRKLLKIKQGLDSLDLETHQLDLGKEQLRIDLHAFKLELEMKRKAEQPFVANESHEVSKVDFDLPPIFDDYSEEENEEEKKAYLVEEEEENEVGVEEEADEGEKLLWERTWNDPKEGNHAYDVPVSQVVLSAFAYDYFEPHKPQMKPEPSDFFVVFIKPLLKDSYNEYEPLTEWILNIRDQSEWSPSNHPVPIPQKQPIWTKQALFAWLILFQPLTSSIPPTLFPKPLTKKFCHKDKWKEPTLVL